MPKYDQEYKLYMYCISLWVKYLENKCDSYMLSQLPQVLFGMLFLSFFASSRCPSMIKKVHHTYIIFHYGCKLKKISIISWLLSQFH